MCVMNTNRYDKDYILSLPFEDGIAHITDIVQNDFKHGISDIDTEIIKNFLSNKCFKSYIDIISETLKDREKSLKYELILNSLNKHKYKHDYVVKGSSFKFNITVEYRI